jgi:hypothetical protein
MALRVQLRLPNAMDSDSNQNVDAAMVLGDVTPRWWSGAEAARRPGYATSGRAEWSDLAGLNRADVTGRLIRLDRRLIDECCYLTDAVSRGID